MFIPKWAEPNEPALAQINLISPFLPYLYGDVAYSSYNSSWSFIVQYSLMSSMQGLICIPDGSCCFSTKNVHVHNNLFIQVVWLGSEVVAESLTTVSKDSDTIR